MIVVDISCHWVLLFILCGLLFYKKIKVITYCIEFVIATLIYCHLRTMNTQTFIEKLVLDIPISVA